MISIFENENGYTFIYLLVFCKLKERIHEMQTYTPRQKSIRALEIFRVQKLILNATS